MKKKGVVSVAVMVLVFLVGVAAAFAEVEIDEEVQVVKTATCITNNNGDGDLTFSVGYTNTGIVTVAIIVQDAPNNVRAFGLDVVYNPEVLSYQEASAGSLVENFDYFDTNLIADGWVRIGGFEAGEELILTGDGGSIVELIFEVKLESCVASPIKIINQKDHIAVWKAASVCLLTGCSEEEGDVNRDGEITPADAQCVFQQYLGLQSCLD